MLYVLIGTALGVVVLSWGGAALIAFRRPPDRSEEIAKLRRMVEDRDLDWVDMRSRCKRLLDRTEKAAGRIKTDEVQSPEASTEPTNGGGNLTQGRMLSPHQLEIQQKILRRRAGA